LIIFDLMYTYKIRPSISIAFCLLFLFCACNSNTHENSIRHIHKKIKIDANPNDVAWQKVEWKSMNQRWLGAPFSEQDFKGRYKIVWDKNHLYVLAEIVDDVLLDQNSDGLKKYWDDDCLEVFLDEDASGGNHQYNYNAFAYHIALDNKVVDIGLDSLPNYYSHIKCRRNTVGQKSIWEMAIDIYADNYQHLKDNKKVVLKEGKEIGFAIAYCDNDKSKERENFIGSVKVKGKDKNRGWIDAGIFQKMKLVKD